MSETVYNIRTISMEHNWEAIAGLSESVIINCGQRPLAERPPWRQFRFARKQHYLGNSL